MERYLPMLSKTPLFARMTTRDIEILLKELGACRKSYDKGSFVFYGGDDVHHLGIVLSGQLHIIQEDYWGNRNIVALIRAGNMFGEAFACLSGVSATVSVSVADKADILFIDVRRLLQSDMALTRPQEMLALNLLGVLAQKNLILTEKIRYISQRSTRQKLMFFLSDEARNHGAAAFTISFNRQELADYLSVDRSAMSAELGKMKKDGLLTYEKNHFILKSTTQQV
ncbi:MAG: Crp/Fnr family transcriptional regulator [Megasphaera sp.]|jgi:CRP-like cAMP-binding protein|nr:Crp/Fnr family transcriptional regulator [Megasphaera sp.]